MSYDAQTIATYNARVQEYVELFTTDTPSGHLRAFMDALPPGGSALDLGCGAGNAAAFMRDAGFQVSAIDASLEMAQAGAAKFNIPIKVGTFDDVTETAIYDGIWASFSLLHAPRADIPRHLKAIHTALKPNGVFVIGVKTGTGEERDTIGRQYTYFEPDELDGILRQAGFTPESSKTGSDKGLSGIVAPWIIITARA